jgi:hypothetical protein
MLGATSASSLSQRFSWRRALSGSFTDDLPWRRSSSRISGAHAAVAGASAGSDNRLSGNRSVTVLHLIVLVPHMDWAKRAVRGTNG